MNTKETNRLAKSIYNQLIDRKIVEGEDIFEGIRVIEDEINYWFDIDENNHIEIVRNTEELIVPIGIEFVVVDYLGNKRTYNFHELIRKASDGTEILYTLQDRVDNLINMPLDTPLILHERDNESSLFFVTKRLQL